MVNSYQQIAISWEKGKAGEKHQQLLMQHDVRSLPLAKGRFRGIFLNLD